MKTLKAASYASQVLYKRYTNFVSRWDDENPGTECYTIAAWCEMEGENDPDFYRWFFNDGDISDYGSDFSDEEKQVAIDFFSSL